MKRTVFLLILLPLLFSSCNFINNILGMGKEGDKKVTISGYIDYEGNQASGGNLYVGVMRFSPTLPPSSQGSSITWENIPNNPQELSIHGESSYYYSLRVPKGRYIVFAYIDSNSNYNLDMNEPWGAFQYYNPDYTPQVYDFHNDTNGVNFSLFTDNGQNPPDTEMPGSITSISIDSITSNLVRLEWPIVNNALGYGVFRKLGYIEGSWDGYDYLADVSPETMTSYEDHLVSADTWYTYYVVAYNFDSDGYLQYGSPSELVQVYTNPDSSQDQIPQAPSLDYYYSPMLEENYYYYFVTVRWDAVPGATWYNIYMLHTEEGELDNPYTSAYSNEIDIHGIEPDISYYFWVSACNSAGESDKSGPLFVRINSDPTSSPPMAPDGFTVQSYTARTVTLEWDYADDVTYWAVYRWDVGGDYNWCGNADWVSFTDSGLSPNTYYSYYVTAWNGYGESGPSISIGVTTAPAAPQNLGTSLDEEAEQVSLAWDPVTGSVAYRIEHSTDGVVFDFTNTGSESFTAEVDLDETHYYRVAGVNSGDIPGDYAEIIIPRRPNVTVTGTTSSSISLEWATIPEATQYTVSWYNKETGFEYGSTYVTELYHTIESLLSPGAEYTINVYASRYGVDGAKQELFASTLAQ